MGETRERTEGKEPREYRGGGWLRVLSRCVAGDAQGLGWLALWFLGYTSCVSLGPGLRSIYARRREESWVMTRGPTPSASVGRNIGVGSRRPADVCAAGARDTRRS